MSVEGNIKIRQHTKQDVPFIMATWLNGLYHGNDWFKAIHKQIYMTNYHTVLSSVLSRPSIEIDLAVDPEDDTVIFGYAVYEGDKLHWIFVKDAFRRFGIAKRLFPNNIKFVTHLTKVGRSLKPREVIFNPFNL